MQQGILIAHVVIGLFLIIFILMQDKGTGLSSTFGGSGTFYASQRGAARVVHILTVLFAVLFFVSALLYIVAVPLEAALA